MEDTVDAEANTEVVGAWFYVDVRSALLKRLAEDEVDVLDDRSVLDHRVEVCDLGDSGLVSGRGLGRSGLGGEGRLSVVPVDA